jgi:hypothetical protein
VRRARDWDGLFLSRVVASLGGDRRNDDFALLPCVCFVSCILLDLQAKARPWVLLSRAHSSEGHERQCGFVRDNRSFGAVSGSVVWPLIKNHLQQSMRTPSF